MTEDSTALAAHVDALLGIEPKKLVQNAEDAKAATIADLAKHPSVLEPKYDGWRLIVRVEPNGVRLYTRSGQDITSRWPALTADLAELPVGTILDGEAVAYEEAKNGELVPRWGTVQSALGSGDAKAALRSGCLTFVAFDLIAHGGLDARTLPLSQRRSLLESLHGTGILGSRVILAPQFTPTESTHVALLEAGYEGSVVKRLDSKYASGSRGKGWSKVKPQTTDEAIVVGFKPGTPGSSFDGMIGAIEFAQYDSEGTLVHRGRCSGMDFEVRGWITENQDDVMGRVFEFAHHGVMPASDKNPHGGYRHPQWKRWREDKAPSEVTF